MEKPNWGVEDMEFLGVLKKLQEEFPMGIFRGGGVGGWMVQTPFNPAICFF